MVRGVVSIAVAMGAFLLALPAAAQEAEDRFAAVLGVQGGLTADEAARLAAERNVEVAIATANLRSAQAQAWQTIWGALPNVSLTARYTRLSDLYGVEENPFAEIFETQAAAQALIVQRLADSPQQAEDILNELRGLNGGGGDGSFGGFDILDQYTVQGDVVVPVSDYIFRIPRLISAAGEAERALNLQTRAARYEVASQARVAYWSWVGARLATIVAEQTVEQARAYVQDVQAAVDAGAAARADLLQAQAQLAQAELARERALAGARVASEQLATSLGAEPGQTFDIGETIDSDVAVETGSVQTLIDEARKRRLEIEALRATVDAARKRASATRVQAWPQLSGFGGITYAQPNQRYAFFDAENFRTTWQAGAKVTWSPTGAPVFLAAADEQEALAEKLEAELNRFELGLRVQIANAASEVERARVALDASARQLAAAEEAYRVRRLLFQNGRATGTEVTQALTDLAQARLAALSARIELRTAAVRLEHAVGRDVREG